VDIEKLSDHDLVILRLLVNNYSLDEWTGCDDKDNDNLFRQMQLLICKMHLAINDEYNNRFMPCSKGNKFRKHKKTYTKEGETKNCHCSKCGIDIYKLYMDDNELDIWRELKPLDEDE
jgi:hypothetical protein